MLSCGSCSEMDYGFGLRPSYPGYYYPSCEATRTVTAHSSGVGQPAGSSTSAHVVPPGSLLGSSFAVGGHGNLSPAVGVSVNIGSSTNAVSRYDTCNIS